MRNLALLFFVGVAALVGCGKSGPSYLELKAKYDYEHQKLEKLQTELSKAIGEQSKARTEKLDHQIANEKQKGKFVHISRDGNDDQKKQYNDFVESCDSQVKFDDEIINSLQEKIDKLTDQCKQQSIPTNAAESDLKNSK